MLKSTRRLILNFFLCYMLISTFSFLCLTNVEAYDEEVEIDSTSNSINEVPNIITGNLNVTTYVGDTVTLPCEVEHLGNHHVNWLKIQNDIPLTLTVGYQQFSRNMRYRVARLHTGGGGGGHHGKNHKKNPRLESWNFEIRKVVPEDEGLYQCYIKLNTKHKLKANVFLLVKSEQEKILDNKSDESQSAFYSSNYLSDNPKSEKLSSNVYEKVDMPPNSWIKLRCNATDSLITARNLQGDSKVTTYSNYDLHWYKDGKLIEQDSRRLKKWVSSYDNSNYMELELFAVDPDDSGVYQCKRDKTILKNVVLNVLENNGLRLIIPNSCLLVFIFSLFSLIISKHV